VDCRFCSPFKEREDLFSYTASGMSVIEGKEQEALSFMVSIGIESPQNYLAALK